MKTVTFKKIELTENRLLIEHLLNNPGILANELQLITGAVETDGAQANSVVGTKHPAMLPLCRRPKQRWQFCPEIVCESFA